MLKHIMLTGLIMGAVVNVSAANTCAVIDTEAGIIEIELYNDRAPITVKNFTRYADTDFYRGTIFHRTIEGFVIQGGGMTKQLVTKPVHQPIKNEADNGLSNLRGTLAMARSLKPDSATSQFFINLADNVHLDRSLNNAGYTVFGRVIKGMEVVEQISRQPVVKLNSFESLPVKPVEILEVKMTCPKSTQKY